MEIPLIFELEAAKHLHKLIQESKDEPPMLATKLYVILSHMRLTGKENSMPYQVILRALETVIKQHNINIDGLRFWCYSLAAGSQLGDYASSHLADCREPWTTKKNHFQNFRTASGQELGKEFAVGVVTVPADDELDPFELWQGTRSPPRRGVSPNEGLAKLPPWKEFPQHGMEVMQDLTDQSTLVNINAIHSGLEVHRLQQRDISVAPVFQGTTLTSEWGQKITREVIEQHVGKKLEDVANILGVSRSTFKRICRENNIFRWPSSKREKLKTVLGADRHNAGDQPHFVSTLNKDTGSIAHPIPQKTTTDYKTPMTVKATYGADIIKFQLSLSSKMMDLVEEVAKRLKLQADNFKAKYIDEDNDLILLACDDDLQKCITTMTSLGKAIVQIVVEPTINQTS